MPRRNGKRRNDLLSATLAAEAEGADPAQLSTEVNRTMQAAPVAAKGWAVPSARARQLPDVSGSTTRTASSRAGRAAGTAAGVQRIRRATEPIGKLQARASSSPA
jgi:hypothetical protein